MSLPSDRELLVTGAVFPLSDRELPGGRGHVSPVREGTWGQLLYLPIRLASLEVQLSPL